MRSSVRSFRQLWLVAAFSAAAGIAAAAAQTNDAGGQDVLSVARASGQFTVLAKAIEAAGLADTLASQGPLTVFAPTDAAFAKLPPAELEALLKPENNERLARILTHHVVAGKALEQDEMKRSRGATTLSGDSVGFELVRGRLRVEDARITADIEASNGVIHAIDRVLIPAS
jgi:uncharacterized surface protein with fasciclin (FAS1) repeats